MLDYKLTNLFKHSNRVFISVFPGRWKHWLLAVYSCIPIGHPPPGRHEQIVGKKFLSPLNDNFIIYLSFSLILWFDTRRRMRLLISICTCITAGLT